MANSKNQGSIFTPQAILYTGMVLGLLAILYVSVKFGFIFGLAASCIPLVFYVIVYSIKNPYWAYTLLFIVNYFIMGLTRYVPELPGGVVVDTLIMSCITILLIRSCYRDAGWARAKNGLTLAAIVWMVYCIFELFNPMAVSAAWIKSIRGVAMYFFFISILTPILFYRYKDFKRILFIWTLLTLCAVAKAYMQRNWGFDVFEKRWLYESGGMTTHIIYSGIRYFSIYTDAGNFGSGMGFAMVVFSIAAFYYKNIWVRLYFLAVAFAAGYGMIISGTRGALAVPFAGYALYIFLSKNKTAILLGTTTLVGAFIFLNFTTIGQSNALVRRMRSAFDTEDASLNVRLDNQRLIREYLADKPFGTGLGMGGGKAKEFAPDAYLSQIPTDSWYVMIGTETGIVGLVLYLGILLYILLTGCYWVLFKIKDKQLRGFMAAILAGIFGMMVSSYGNEIFGQLPSGIIIYMCQAFVFLSLRYDKEITENRLEEKHEYDE